MKLATLILFLFPSVYFAQYKGTGSVTKGKGNTLKSPLYSCTGGRPTALGSIVSTDNENWIVPASVNFDSSGMPFAPDLYNQCNGSAYAGTAQALAAFKVSDIVTIDADGELITAYVFADNYFEMFINGKPVGKDKVPFTPFNSSLLKFRVKRPFTIAMLLVDWEESLGLGTEANGGFAYHPGDGGMVAVFKDTLNKIIAITNSEWKAQTYYTAPIKDLKCPTEQGNLRLSGQCNVADENDGSQWYALHWNRPDFWMNADFDDANWPAAYEYTNTQIGVDNKPAYTNFTDVFDASGSDAKFIWSSNLILDNELLVRYTVPGALQLEKIFKGDIGFKVFPNPADKTLCFALEDPETSGDLKCELLNLQGVRVAQFNVQQNQLSLSSIASGMYVVKMTIQNHTGYQYLVVQHP